MQWYYNSNYTNITTIKNCTRKSTVPSFPSTPIFYFCRTNVCKSKIGRDYGRPCLWPCWQNAPCLQSWSISFGCHIKPVNGCFQLRVMSCSIAWGCSGASDFRRFGMRIAFFLRLTRKPCLSSWRKGCVIKWLIRRYFWDPEDWYSYCFELLLISGTPTYQLDRWK